MIVDIDKVITLENKEKYLVLDKVVSNGTEYFYIAKINDTETDIENNYKLVTVVNKNGSNVIEEVVGTDKLREILPLFTKQL